MADLDALTNQFAKLLGSTENEYTLAEWRYAYRKVIYSMGLRVLMDFPEIIVGPPPSSVGSTPLMEKGPPGDSPGFGGGNPGSHPIIAGQQPPYRPSAIGTLVCLVLGDCQQQT
jgi:hypothetical protein